MNRDKWQRAKQIFNSALDLDPGKRRQYLAAECDGNTELRQQVEDLLNSYESEFMETPIRSDEKLGGGRLVIGSQLGRFEIVRLISVGGMGEVYLARDDELSRKVAIKVLNEKYERDEANLHRFIQEAKAASALNHPNILTIYEIGQREDSHFIVSEFVDGKTLRSILNERKLSPPETLGISIQIAEALSTAHAARIIHRDIKPENIILRSDGYVKVVDFGLAKLIPSQPSFIGLEEETARQNQTAQGLILGTVSYMSPEQARGEKVDERTDIFSLGVVIYEMISGRTPFVGSSMSDAFANLINKEPEPLSRFAPVVPDELQRIVSKMLRKEPDGRYQTMKGLLADLKELKERQAFEAKLKRSPSTETERDTAVLAQTTGDAARTTVKNESRPSPRRPGLVRASLLAAAVLILAAASLTYVYTTRKPAISSIAVLPFTNMNADPEIDFLADGITDNIIQRLSHIADLKVMAHTAVFRYKGKDIDPRTVGSELGVEAVLTGRFVKRNDALTISLELINARDNSHIWGEQYDRDLSDLLALQREIPVDVSDNLRLRLSGESKERLTHAYTNNSEAYQLYLKGRYFLDQWTTSDSKKAIEFFEEAIRRDANYALAYAGLAEAYIWGPRVGLSQEETHRRAKEATTKALSLDPQLGEAHAALSKILLYEDWDFAAAERELKRAIELSPSYPEGHHTYSHLLLLLGRTDESFTESKKYLDLDPVSDSPIGHIAYHYLYARQYDEAIIQYQKQRQLYPTVKNPDNYIQSAQAYYQKGMFQEAVDEYLTGFERTGSTPDKIAALRKAFAASGIRGFYLELIAQFKGKPQTEQDKVWIAECYARLGEKDQAFEWLEKAYAEHDDGLVRLKEELGFDNIRSDPRYTDLLHRIGLPQ